MMCQRPDCAYVHPTFAKYMYQNQMKKKGKGKGAPHGVHMPYAQYNPHGPKKVKEGENAE